MSDKCIIVHDMGTSGDKAVIVTVKGEIIHSIKQTYPIHHPQPGYAEQDPDDWWRAVCATTRQAMQQAGISVHDVVGLTFSSQVMSLVAIDREGKPLMPAMTWLDTRSSAILHKRLWKPPRIMGYNIFHLLRFLLITGGSPGHTGKDQIGKILWLRESRPELFEKVYKFIDAKDYIVYKLTGNVITSADIAYVWWMLDTRKKRNKWHARLCRLAGIRPDQLAEVRESADIAGELSAEAAREMGLIAGIPVINGAGDLSSSALGSGAIDEGELHVRIGTSGGVAGHFGKRKIDVAHYAGCIGSTWPQKYYLGIAHQETAGLCLEWLKNNVLYHQEQLKEERNVEQIYQVLDQLAAAVEPGAAGLIFTPWMLGERCPLDNTYVRAGLFNLSLHHKRDHIIRAVFEGIAFNTRWAMETLEKLYAKVTHLNAIGGGAKSDTWCQILADVTDREINQITDPQETNARGVALLAAMTLGYIESYHDIRNYIKIKKTFTPDPRNRDIYDRLFREFKNIYRQNKSWYKRMNRQG